MKTQSSYYSDGVEVLLSRNITPIATRNERKLAGCCARDRRQYPFGLRFAE